MRGAVIEPPLLEDHLRRGRRSPPGVRTSRASSANWKPCRHRGCLLRIADLASRRRTPLGPGWTTPAHRNSDPRETQDPRGALLAHGRTACLRRAWSTQPRPGRHWRLGTRVAPPRCRPRATPRTRSRRQTQSPPLAQSLMSPPTAIVVGWNHSGYEIT
jgi:hypothetical protein